MRTSTAVFQSPSAEKPQPYSDGNRCGPTPGSCGRAPRSSKLSTPAVQPFFVSRTRFEQRQYDAASIAPVLERAGVQAEDYRRHGLFVLRSTVMNPWYDEAEAAGMDYLRGFVQHLHSAAASAMQQVEQARRKMIYDKVDDL